MQVRDRLLLAAEREFADKGTLDARLADIRETVGVSVGALYHHFPDKSALYHAVWLHALADYQTNFWNAIGDSTSAEQGVKTAVLCHLQWVTDNPSRAKVLTSPKPPNVEFSPQNLDFFRNVLRWWRTHAAYGAVQQLDFEIIHALWLGPAQEYCRLWLGGEIANPPGAVAETLADAAWRCVKVPDNKGQST